MKVLYSFLKVLLKRKFLKMFAKKLGRLPLFNRFLISYPVPKGLNKFTARRFVTSSKGNGSRMNN